jgi:hypothetical protein
LPIPITAGIGDDLALGIYEKTYRDSTHTKLGGDFRLGI